MDKKLLHMKLDAKNALLKVCDKELGELTGRFLSPEEQLRVLSLGEETDKLEREIADLEIQLGGEI